MLTHVCFVAINKLWAYILKVKQKTKNIIQFVFYKKNFCYYYSNIKQGGKTHGKKR